MADITVLMAVYNGMPYLPLAIESILNQTYTDFEFLIINDCSSDNSRDVILSYGDPRIRLIDNQENINQTKSLNRGLKHTKTDLVARMDADDVSQPHRLGIQVEYLRKHPEVAAVGTNLRFIDHAGRVNGEFQFPEHDIALRWLQLFECPISCGAVMFRKNVVWDKLGGFDPSVRFSQDWELWSRMPRESKLANLPELLVDVRKHGGNAATAFHDVNLAEHRRINKINPERILGITDDSEEWMAKIDTLVSGVRNHPKPLLEVIQTFYERFCNLYPTAHRDPDVLMELSRQYLRVLYYADRHSLPTALKAIRLSWPISSKPLLIYHIARLAAICAGGRMAKRWTIRMLSR